MGLFGKKKIGDFEIIKKVKCVKCKTQMYLPKPVEFTSYGSEGAIWDSCGKYLCVGCLREAHMGQYQCCPGVTSKGVTLINYLDERDPRYFKK